MLPFSTTLSEPKSLGREKSEQPGRALFTSPRAHGACTLDQYDLARVLGANFRHGNWGKLVLGPSERTFECAATARACC
jgi:hypothetical protein